MSISFGAYLFNEKSLSPLYETQKVKFFFFLGANPCVDTTNLSKSMVLLKYNKVPNTIVMWLWTFVKVEIYSVTLIYMEFKMMIAI